MHWVDKFKLIKQERGLSVRGIERLIGLSTNVLSVSMSRRGMPAVKTCINLARALNVTTDWLFDESVGLDCGSVRMSASDRLFLESVKVAQLRLLVAGQLPEQIVLATVARSSRD